MDMEQHISKPIWQSQEHHQEECNHGILQWKVTNLLGNKYAGCGSRRNVFWVLGSETPNSVVLQQMAFASKSLSSAETCYSNIERETLGILHDLENFHHYCFTHKVNVITNHKLLVAILKKNVASQWHRLQRVLQVHHYSIRILYKLQPQLFIAYLLSRHNHKTNRDEEKIHNY